MLDTVKKIQTPEGVELELAVAGISSRFLAWLLDFIFKALVLSVLSPIAVFFGDFGVGVLLIISFLVLWFYGVVFEAIRGATPGKKIIGLRVINDNGTPLGWSGSIVRNFLRSADMLPAFYTFGILSIIMNKDFKRLGDFAAGTIVVYEDKISAKSHVPKQVPKAPPFALNEYEQRNIVQFAERSDCLSEARLVELAQILLPVHALHDAQSATEIIKYANWIVGRR